MTSFSKKYFDGLNEALGRLDFKAIDKFSEVLWKAGKSRKTIFFIGNGGSASTATHMAADIGKNTSIKGKKMRFKTMALTDNVAWMTALGNDLSYEDIFVEQLMNFAQRGDLLVVISGSGNSGNIIKALTWAKKAKLKTVGMLGFGGGRALKMVDLSVLVPVDHYGWVEGIHSEIQHCVIEDLKIRMKENG